MRLIRIALTLPLCVALCADTDPETEGIQADPQCLGRIRLAIIVLPVTLCVSGCSFVLFLATGFAGRRARCCALPIMMVIPLFQIASCWEAARLEAHGSLMFFIANVAFTAALALFRSQKGPQPEDEPPQQLAVVVGDTVAFE